MQQVVDIVQNHATSTATATSVVSALMAWLPVLQPGLQFVATCVAIAAGSYAIRAHRLNIKSHRGKNASTESVQPGPVQAGADEAPPVGGNQ